MKILFKHITNEYQNKRIEFSEASDLVFNILDQAFMSSIIVWHAGKGIAFDSELLDFINFDKLTINWGGYGSRIPLEKLYEYFNFQYPGDEVIDGKLKSKITNRKDSFKLVKGYFENHVDEDIKNQFVSLGGTISTLGDEETFVWVSKERLSAEQKSSAINKAEIEGGLSLRKFVFLSEEDIKFLFPAKIVRTKTVVREKKEVPDSIEKKSLSQLQKLLTSRDINQINQGLTLAAGLNDVEVYRYFLEDISVAQDEDGYFKLVPNKYFDNPKVAMPFYNYTMLSLILASMDIFENSTKIIAQLESLNIDLADFSVLEKLNNLKKLKLSCSTNNIKEFPYIQAFQSIEELDLGSEISFINIDNIGKLHRLKKLVISNNKELKNVQSISELTQLEYLDISNCEQIDSIEFVSGLNNLNYFDFSNCKKISVLKPLSGKRLSNKYLNIKENNISDLTGIGAYQELEALSVCNINETKVKNSIELTNLPNLKDLYSFKTRADYTESGELNQSNTSLSLHIHYPSTKYEIKNDSYELKFDLVGVNQYEAIGEKVFCKKLEIKFYELKSLDFLTQFSSLETLTLVSTKTSQQKLSDLDFSVLKSIKTLNSLELTNINVEDFSFLLELPQVEHLSFNNFATLKSFEGLQQVKSIRSYSGFYISTYKTEFKEDVIFNACRELYYQTNKKFDSSPTIYATSLRPITENEHIVSNIYDLSLRNFKQLNDFGTPSSFSKLVELSLESRYPDTFSAFDNWHEFPSLRRLEIKSNLHLKFSERADKLNILIKSSLADMKDVNISGKGVGNIYIAMHQGFDLTNYFKGLEKVDSIIICNAEYLQNLDFMHDVGSCDKLVLDTKKELQLLQIDGLKKHTSLKHLEVPTAKKITDVSVIKGMTELQYLDLSTCTGLTVKPRPVLMKTREEVSAYQNKL